MTTESAGHSQLEARVAAELQRQLATPPTPGLYLVATPIGNLADITLRALCILARADIVLCEDTRHSRTLIAHYGLGARLVPYHEHNEDAERPRVLAALAQGKMVALISDAGTPLISDPGFKLAREAASLGLAVVSVPGASALLAALTASGLPTDAFFFAGFLPSKSPARRTRLAELSAMPATLIFYEAPTRAAESLADMGDVLGQRPAVLARELTKLHEDVVRLPLDELSRYVAQSPLKGEMVIVVGPPLVREIDDDAIAAELRNARQSLSLRDAARIVADKLGIAKSRVYDLGVRLDRDET